MHVVTQKGKGYPPAEKARDRCHSVAPFDIATGIQVKTAARAPTFTKVFGETLVKEARKDSRIVAVTAAMPAGTGLDIFAKAFPERMFDVGIAEQHAVTFAAGLAAEGCKPFCAIYSTFLQRGYDQVVHDVALQSLPVRFAIDRAGYVGADGPTHAGSFDVAYLACLPGFTVMAAADEEELAHMVATAVAIDDSPSAIRYPRGEAFGAAVPEEGRPIRIGKGRIVRHGRDVALLSLGARLAECRKAADELSGYGISVTVADARFAKPLDVALILELADEHEALITIEEGSIGGFGSHVAQLLLEHGRLDGGLKARSMVLPDAFAEQDDPAVMYARAKLDANGIVAKVFDTLNREPRAAWRARFPFAPSRTSESRNPIRVLLAKPRGFCAGVVRAIDIVERALQKHEAPVYVRHEIVHNKRVVDSLKAKGVKVRRGARRDPRQRDRHLQRPRRPEAGRGRGRRARARRPRRDLPARHQGPQPGETVCRAGAEGRADRTRRPSGGRRHARPGLRADRAGAEGERRRAARHSGERAGRIHHPDDAQRRRHEGDHRSPAPSLHRPDRPRHPGHLLRDPEQAAGRPRALQGGRRRPGGRRPEQLQFEHGFAR